MTEQAIRAFVKARLPRLLHNQAKAFLVEGSRAHGKTPTQRVADYLALLGMETSERVRLAIASLLPPGTSDQAVAATIRHMRRRWLELYGDDPFFGED